MVLIYALSNEEETSRQTTITPPHHLGRKAQRRRSEAGRSEGGSPPQGATRGDGRYAGARHDEGAAGATQPPAGEEAADVSAGLSGGEEPVRVSAGALLGAEGSLPSDCRGAGCEGSGTGASGAGHSAGEGDQPGAGAEGAGVPGPVSPSCAEDASGGAARAFLRAEQRGSAWGSASEGGDAPGTGRLELCSVVFGVERTRTQAAGGGASGGGGEELAPEDGVEKGGAGSARDPGADSWLGDLLRGKRNRLVDF